MSNLLQKAFKKIFKWSLFLLIFDKNWYFNKRWQAKEKKVKFRLLFFSMQVFFAPILKDSPRHGRARRHEEISSQKNQSALKAWTALEKNRVIEPPPSDTSRKLPYCMACTLHDPKLTSQFFVQALWVAWPARP